MPKNIVQDVVPRNKRGIRDIPLPKREEARPEAPARKSREENANAARYSSSENEERSWKRRNEKSRGGWFVWFAGAVSILVLVVVLGNLLSGATVTVNPRTQSVVLDLDFTARPKPLSGELAYTSFSLVREKEAAVTADSEQNVETRASGKIIVYNSYSTAKQRLVKNTRFETPDGLVYKITESITIPGRHSVGGKSVPGSVEALVSAESAGDEYNIGLTDFTIPGFASDQERFKNFYARSKTAMTGGKVGTEKTISDEKMLQTRGRLTGELTQTLLTETRKRVPEGFVFYERAYRTDFENLPPAAPKNDNTVGVRERGRLTAVFIKRDDLAKLIAKNSVDSFDGASVDVPDLDALSFNLKNPNDIDQASSGPVRFNLKGSATIIWQFDRDKLSKELAGKSKSELTGIVSHYPSIIKADAVIRPFWKSAFPASPAKVKIETAKKT